MMSVQKSSNISSNKLTETYQSSSRYAKSEIPVDFGSGF